jgi:hypothetical protein
MAKIVGQPSSTEFLRYFRERCAKEATIVVTPAFDSNGSRRHELFEARLLGHEEIICISAQPLLDCSRILLQAGFQGSAMLKMVHGRSPQVIALSGRIEDAAQLDVMGARFVRRKPSALMSGPASGQDFRDEADFTPHSKTPPCPSDKAEPGRIKPKS